MLWNSTLNFPNQTDEFTLNLSMDAAKLIRCKLPGDGLPPGLSFLLEGETENSHG
jgi:hypothetical protein